MSPSYDQLPEEIWELILNRLNDDHHSHFESLSIVNKRLLSLTNRLRLRFTVVDGLYFSHGTISPHIHRFKHLKTLDLSRLKCRSVDTVLHEIARSSVAFNLESLDISNQLSVSVKSLEALGSSNCKLKVLRCVKLMQLSDEDLTAIAKFQPYLEELDISYPRYEVNFTELRNFDRRQLVITDAGIEILSSNLKNLIKINISGNRFLTDKSVLALSSNCSSLRKLTILDCFFITTNAIQLMLHNNPNLCAISMSIFQNRQISSLFDDSAASGKRLSSLDFRNSGISDEFLHSIAKAGIPLKRISLSFCLGYTVDGISRLLSVYQSLEFLDLSRNDFLTDDSFIGLSQYLHYIVSIKLNFCSKLTSIALFTLINNCPFLESIEMKSANFRNKNDFFKNIEKKPNSNVKSLNLAENGHLNDECLVNIALVCPKLEVLDVSYCSSITWAVGEVLHHCSEIRHLNIQGCLKVTKLGLKMETYKLENLYMSRSGLNDEGLLEIGKRCKWLVKIDMGECLYVTMNAVKEMLKNLERLREINLKGCRNVNELCIEQVVFTRPSMLKKIVPPFNATTSHQRRLLSRHGCQICEN